jgi:hypothetical protein
MKSSFVILPAALILSAAAILTVAETPSKANSQDGQFISWREHLVDDQQLSGGLPIRGGDGLQMADFDRDGFSDIVSVHEDSSHIRIAFGSASPDKWILATLASGKDAAAAEDVSTGDLNNDGWPDIIAACELGHLIYFQNPGKDIRTGAWPRVIPDIARGRGSYIRVFFADFNRDGKLELVAPNKGEQLNTTNPRTQKVPTLPEKEISWYQPPLNPLTAQGWKEHVLTRVPIPINSQPVDIDSDGDLDVIAGSRGQARLILFENVSRRGGVTAFRQHPIQLKPEGRATAFMVDFADLNKDGRLDMALVESRSGVVWLEQPPSFDQPWPVHLIGHIAPDVPTAITLADINGDGRPDLITGGYSQDPRDHDGPNINAESVCGRIAWFENPVNPAGNWIRHDVTRQKRGMYDAFLARDMDRDGDTDLVGTRGNSGNFDGVFWLEQIRSSRPQRSYFPAREQESAHLPLPSREHKATSTF